ncbi:hypothetical protein B0H17DRAFT_1139220 [Mycena rosella]|uniref:Uncharacterized protein n=1 Tax=Mycena rosella TaxID=1033263 RepID=A0AAD7D4T2_MYCRO|nr:hypothetical protein B0H17DRAFT_1142611 [Mycena rosella]KAJ7678827.1 hypothetical protein B0H17DRAFT_1139220 [Mycena rosella]
MQFFNLAVLSALAMGVAGVAIPTNDKDIVFKLDVVFKDVNVSDFRGKLIPPPLNIAFRVWASILRAWARFQDAIPAPASTVYVSDLIRTDFAPGNLDPQLELAWLLR